MAGYNRIIIVGNLTRDPEVKQFASGQSVAKLGVASNRSFKNRQTGAVQQEVCFVDVDVWGPQADACRQYLSKGRPVLVEGRLKLETWQDAQGANRSKHTISADRVIFLSASASTDSINDVDAAADMAQEPVSYSTQNTQEFMKVEQAIAKKQAAKKTTAAKRSDDDLGIAGSPEFKDEPPFDEELPF